MKTRTEVMNEIMKVYRAQNGTDQEGILLESLKRMGDLNLFAFATELGVNVAVRP